MEQVPREIWTRTSMIPKVSSAAAMRTFEALSGVHARHFLLRFLEYGSLRLSYCINRLYSAILCLLTDLNLPAPFRTHVYHFFTINLPPALMRKSIWIPHLKQGPSIAAQ